MRSTVILLFYNNTSLFPFNDFKQIYLFIAAVFFHIQWLASLVKAKNAAKKCTLKSSLCLQQGQQHSVHYSLLPQTVKNQVTQLVYVIAALVLKWNLKGNKTQPNQQIYKHNWI